MSHCLTQNEAGFPAELSSSAGTESGKHRDLRDFIQLLENAGRLVRVSGAVDWKFEIGSRTRADQQPLLFENVKGYANQRVFTNGLSDMACIGLALGFEPGTSHASLVAEARKRLAAPLQPRIVDSGPVLENAVEGNDLDLFRLAVPQWSKLDAGRYLGTWHLNISKDPETAKRNVGVYRMQLLGPQQATVSAAEGSDLARHVAKAEAQDQALPMAVAIGAPEAVVIAAAAACPAGMDEFELAGALQQQAVELIRCQSVNLEVPARSEIVIEGFIHPGIRVQDGPYLDYCGRTNTNPKAFLFEAQRLMFRNDPVFRGSSIGIPGAEDHQLFAFLAQLKLVDFHGSRAKQKVQNVLWRHRAFRLLQLVGRIGSGLRKLK